MSTRTAASHASHARSHGLRHASAGGDGPAPEVHTITDAIIPLEVDQARRMKRYLIEMGVRVLCFVAAFVAYEIYPNPFLVLGLVAAAAVLPYVAVVGVNAGRERGEGAGTYVTVAHHVLDGPPTRMEDEQDDGAATGLVIEGRTTGPWGTDPEDEGQGPASAERTPPTAQEPRE